MDSTQIWMIRLDFALQEEISIQGLVSLDILTIFATYRPTFLLTCSAGII